MKNTITIAIAIHMSVLIGNVNDSSEASGGTDGAGVPKNAEVADGGSVTVGDKVVVHTTFIVLYIRPIAGARPIVVKPWCFR